MKKAKNKNLNVDILKKKYIGKMLMIESNFEDKIFCKKTVIITDIVQPNVFYSSRYYIFKGYDFYNNSMETDNISEDIIVKINEDGSSLIYVPSLNSGNIKISHKIV